MLLQPWQGGVGVGGVPNSSQNNVMPGWYGGGGMMTADPNYWGSQGGGFAGVDARTLAEMRRQLESGGYGPAAQAEGWAGFSAGSGISDGSGTSSGGGGDGGVGSSGGGGVGSSGGGYSGGGIGSDAAERQDKQGMRALLVT